MADSAVRTPGSDSEPSERAAGGFADELSKSEKHAAPFDALSFREAAGRVVDMVAAEPPCSWCALPPRRKTAGRTG